MIFVEHLSKRFGATYAVDDVSFSTEPGEILGLLGPNGAGKTTIMRILTCFFPPTSGVARVAGYDVTQEPMKVRGRVGYLPEMAPLYREMKVRPFLRFAAEIKGLSGRERDAAVEKIIAETNLTTVAQRIIGNLSRGYRQRVGLAQALIGDPKVLILDEPTAGLDPSQVIEVRELIRSMSERRTVILSTHILPEVTAVCQKVVIINQGKLMAWGTPSHLHSQFKQAGRVDVVFSGGGLEEARLVMRSMPCVEAILEGRQTEPSRYHFAMKTAEGGAPEIARRIVEKGWQIHDLREGGDSLEEVFKQAICAKQDETK
ncbi:MAG: ATP-binding cassette domain-containing protein [Candidatus Sumerlaeota bacterium]|nr:ATP-binding cassette domain-containing protein [Candidatus Sumerlaeota bacterium]